MRLLFLYKSVQCSILAAISILLLIPIQICFINNIKVEKENQSLTALPHVSSWICAEVYPHQRYCQEKDTNPYSTSFCLADKGMVIPTVLTCVSFTINALHLIFMAGEGKFVQKQKPGFEYFVNLLVCFIWLAASCMLAFIHVHWSSEWKSEWLSWPGNTASNASLNQRAPRFPVAWFIAHALAWINLLLHVVEEALPFSWHQGHIKLQNLSGHHRVHRHEIGDRRNLMPPDPEKS